MPASKFRHVAGQRALGYQVRHLQRHDCEAPNAERRAIKRQWRNNRIDARTIGQAGIGHRAGFVDPATDARYDLVDDLHQYARHH